MKLALVTPSFHRDYEMCVDLCESVDRFGEAAIEHILVVPSRDMKLFGHLNGSRRRVVAKEDFLPSWIVTIPFPAKLSLPGIGTKHVRTMWVTPRLRMVRGWILQQVIKFSADRLTDADGVIFADSDVAFVRPFGIDNFVRDNKLMLHMEPDCIEHDNPLYSGWQDIACDLLGMPRFPFGGDSYVAAVVPWRCDRLRECQRRIEEAAGMDFRSALLRCSQLSEYVVYGLYCRQLADGDAGHYIDERPVVLGDWHFDTSNEDGIDEMIRGLQPYHLAMVIQSTNDWPIERRRRAIKAAQERV